MRREPAKLLYDVAEACREIELFSTGQTRSSVLGNRGLQLALQKLVEIEGETLNHLSKLDHDMALRVPDLRQYVDLGNRMSHEYDSVDYAIFWEVVQQQIPYLYEAVILLLEEAPALTEPEQQIK